jgi:hypothetical protein
MNSAKLKTYLEITSAVAVIAVAVAVLSSIVRSELTHPPKVNLQPGLERGGQLTNLAFGKQNGVKHAQLILAMSTTCHFCEESIPFYNKLSDGLRNTSGSPTFVALFRESTEQVSAFSQQRGLTVSTVAAVDFRTLHVAGTPTIILLDESGKVVDFWVGKLSTEEEQAVFARLGLRST